MARKHTIIATFDSTMKAEAAVEQLLAHGFASSELTVLMSDRARGQHFAVDARHEFPRGAALGGLLGGSVGAAVVGFTSAAGFVWPGLDQAIGPVLAALAGAGLGGLLGWLTGGLIGLGFDGHEARLRDSDGGDGHILLGIRTESDVKAEFAERTFETNGATSVAA